MGTPDFAVPSLEALLKSDDQVVGVVTQPDRPKGRGTRGHSIAGESRLPARGDPVAATAQDEGS